MSRNNFTLPNNKKTPDISVIMPVYNSEKNLSVAIESILKQTFKNFEFIITDDGSKDGSWGIIKDYALKDRRIRVKRNINNIGICKTLNSAILIARGKYIARMDSDDFSYPERLKKQYIYMNSHPDVVICGSAVEICNTFLKVKNKRYYPISDKKIREKILKINPFAHPAVMYKKETVIKAGCYNDKMFAVEDYDLYFRLGKLGKFANLQDTLIKLRIRNKSVSYANIQKQGIFHLYTRLKACTEYGYKFHFKDVVFFVLELFGVLIIPAKFQFKLYNYFRKYI